MRIRSLAAAIALLATTRLTLASSAELRAQTAPRFEGVVRFASRMEGIPVELVYFARGSKVRTEMNSPRMRMVMLSDTDAGQVVMVDDKSQTYSVWGGEDDQDDGEFVTFTRTGVRERVAGYECVYYHLEMADGTKADICAAAGMGVLMAGGRGQWASKSATEKALVAKNPDFARAMREGFVPLKWKAWMPDEPEAMGMTATSVERKPIDPALVSIPTSYKRIEMPGATGRKP